MRELDLGEHTRAHIAQSLLCLDGKPYSLYDYPFLPAVYNTSGREVLLKTSRQISKSTTCACLMITDSVAIPHFRTLYVSPTREQTSKFSNTRLTKIIHYSPLIRSNYVDSNLSNNVLLQILSNGSEMSLSYAWDDPDRIRGITADRELIDEVQDVVYDAVIPVTKECMANSDYALMIYCGTPKSMENTIEFLWQKSTQAEWIMECSRCGSWGFVDSVRSIGRKGIVCLKCDAYLNPRRGQWYEMNPGAQIKGFHVSQPMLPRNVEIPARWERILEKMEDYSSTQFKNEVLGMSDDIGTRFISQAELLALCQDYYVDLPLSPIVLHGIRTIIGGVDWAGNSDSGSNSRTVAWVWGLTNDFRLKTLYFRIFQKANAIEDVEEVARIFKTCQCHYVIGDAGEGAVANSVLRDKLGTHRVGQVQYGGGAGFSQLIRWNRQGTRYLVNRTAAIDSFMLQMKKQGIVFANARQMAVPIQDILNVYQESTHSGQGGSIRSIWKHAPNCPDDSLHAMIFGWLAYKVVAGELQFYDREDES